jgi:glucose 1-dehydrogenase
MQRERGAALPEVVMPECPSKQILKGQTSLVTGANSGIGQAIAAAQGEAGAKVMVNYVVGDEQVDAVVEQIRNGGGQARAHRADVSREAEVLDMSRKMIGEFGTIDVLINNAGLQWSHGHGSGGGPHSTGCSSMRRRL